MCFHGLSPGPVHHPCNRTMGIRRIGRPWLTELAPASVTSAREAASRWLRCGVGSRCPPGRLLWDNRPNHGAEGAGSDDNHCSERGDEDGCNSADHDVDDRATCRGRQPVHGR